MEKFPLYNLEEELWSQLNHVKKVLNLTNEDLGLLLDKNKDAVRKAINRKSLNDYEIKFLAKSIASMNLAKSLEDRQAVDRLLHLVRKKINIITSNILDRILSVDEENILKEAIKDDPAYNRVFESIKEKDELSEAKEPDAMYVEFQTFMHIPLIQKRAQAGFLSGWGDDEYIEELPTIPWEVDKEYKGKYLAFEVTGDSMDDDSRESIIEGDILICREVQRIHWRNHLHLHRWKNFVVVHRKEGILVKRVLKHDIETGRLVLHSLNPLFEDQEVFMDDLIAIFNVIDIHRSL